MKRREKTFCLVIFLAQGLHYVINLAIVRKIWTRTAPVIVISDHQVSKKFHRNHRLKDMAQKYASWYWEEREQEQ